jgi:NADH:ubiquinone reductase (H+-translocating)
MESGVARTRNGEISFDLAVWTGGFVPPAIGRRAGLPVDAAGGIVVDENLQAIGHPEIFVAGDAASCYASWGHLRMGCVTASPMGAHAGENARRLLSGEPLRPFDFAFPGRNISLGRGEALLQLTDYSDGPSDRIFTGRIAVFVKELIGKGTFRTPQWELKHGLKLIDLFGRKVPADAKRFDPAGEIEWKATV